MLGTTLFRGRLRSSSSSPISSSLTMFEMVSLLSRPAPFAVCDVSSDRGSMRWNGEPKARYVVQQHEESASGRRLVRSPQVKRRLRRRQANGLTGPGHYVFDARGRHLRVVLGLTGAVFFEFRYDQGASSRLRGSSRRRLRRGPTHRSGPKTSYTVPASGKRAHV